MPLLFSGALSVPEKDSIPVRTVGAHHGVALTIVGGREMRRTRIPLALSVSLLPMIAQAQYMGSNFEALVKQTALEKCRYLHPVLQKQNVGTGLAEYQFVCDNGTVFSKVIFVKCVQLAYKVRERYPDESREDYEAFQQSIQDPRPWFRCD